MRGGENDMPTISQFFGIVIQMFWREHAPPHFHALYAEYEALIDVRTLEMPAETSTGIGARMGSTTPNRVDGGLEHLCQLKQLPKNIAPLE